jgi:hypothetical protein
MKNTIRKMDDTNTKEAVCISFPAVIKASKEDGKRILEVQASSEDRDLEGDVILQKALLDSADSFIENGHIDLDHISEIGHRYGIENPDQYILGYPLAVIDKGKGRTSVRLELIQDAEGEEDPKAPYNFIWKSLHTKPPMKWSASIYGFPKDGEWKDCSETECSGSKATRYLVEGLDWKSLALTRKPVNDKLKGFAKVVKSSFYMERILGLEKAKDPKETCTCKEKKEKEACVCERKSGKKKECGFLKAASWWLALELILDTVRTSRK